MSHARSHDWIKSTLGHGETMCRNCSITNREAAVLGCLDVCDAAPVPSGQTVIEAASNNFGLTVADLDERREAIARLVGKHLGPYLAISPTARYEAIVREFIRELLASGLVQDEAAIPDGYALVPIKPTSSMIEAGCEHNPTQWNEGTDMGFVADVANDVYVSMVNAAHPLRPRRG